MVSDINIEAMADPEPVADPLKYPLTFTQQRLWFLDKLDPGKSVYNVSEALRLKGPLDRNALTRSINDIIKRHDTLRTTFCDVDGSPLQVVSPSLTIDIPTESLAHLPAAEREQEATRRTSDRANQPFDLAHGPLIRVSLVQIADNDHVLLISMHHIISEGGWSMGIFLRELNALYNSHLAQQPPALPDLPIQYGDYAVWQRDWMQGEVREQLLDYWTERLKGAPTILDLPTDRPRPSQQSYNGSKESRLLPSVLKTALSDFSKAEGATLFMTLFAGFNTLLSRYTSQEDLVVGVSVAGRGSPETHDLIGFFANTLAVRTELSDDPSFRQLVRRSKQVCIGAYDHEDLPYELLVEVMNPERSLAYSPLFQVMFAYQNAPRQDLHLAGLQASSFDIETRTSMFDLTLFVWERPDGVLLTMEYSTDLFGRPAIQRLLQHFEVLLIGVIANPDAPVSRLPLLPQEERRTVVTDWNDFRRSYPDRRMHELFEEQVQRTPDQTALIFRGKALSFAELNRLSNQLARYLRQKGVSTERLVGLCMERSFEMVIALLGVLKAGGAYVPYDPDLPASRLNTMLEDSKPVCVITQQKFGASLSACPGPVIVLDSEIGGLAAQPSSNLNLSVGPKDAIYAIYTSGSTGLPKAAINTHEAVVNRILWMQDEYQLSPGDRVMQKTPYTFDVSVWEFFWPILCGAILVIAEPGGHRDPSYLANLIAQERITTIHFVPSMLREFLEAADPRQCASLKRVICSGEALPPDLRQKFYERLRSELHNLYGPTEAAVDVTYWDCSREAACASVPIGRPIANVSTYILDRHLEPVPIGVVGELYLGGIGVGRGYLNRPELTAERFIPDPFASDPSARLYRTGDRARFLPGGDIEYLGRNDNQVKLRGFRIELGEIESTILLHDQVRTAAVVVRQDQNGDKLLIGYVVRTGSALESQVLKAFLKERLPDYMVPAHFVFLDSLPMLSNGKLNRGALPAPENMEGVRGRALVAPRDPTEEKLVAIWEQLLNRRPVGVHDDYFDLGGHSLMAVRLFSEIKKAFGIELPLASLYQAPTIELLARLVSQGGRSDLRASLVPINRMGRKPPLYCVSGIGGGVLVFRDLAVELGQDQPFYGLQPKSEGDRIVALTSIPEIASHYIESIRESQPDGPYYLSGYSFGGLVAFEMARQLTSAGFAVPFLGLFDTSAPVRAKVPGSLLPRRTYGTAWERTLQILSSDEVLEKIKQIVKRRVYSVHERVARKVGLPLPAELETLSGSQGFAAVNYVGEPYGGPITLFRSQVRPANELWSHTLGWESLVSNVDVRDVPGDHLSIYSGDNLAVLASSLKNCLEQVQTQSETLS